MPAPLKTVEKLRRQEKAKIIFIGDSNTALTFHTHGFLNVVGLVECAIFMTYANTRSQIINAALCGEGANGVLARLDDDVISHKPDLVIVGYGMTAWRNGDTHLQGAFIQPMREIIRRVRAVGSEIIIRTPNPIICVNQPHAPADQIAGQEFPDKTLGIFVHALVDLAKELDCHCVDHYKLWLETKYLPHMNVNSPNGLWNRMSDLTHPNEIGHRAFYRDLAPLLGLPVTLAWEV